MEKGAQTRAEAAKVKKEKDGSVFRAVISTLVGMAMVTAGAGFMVSLMDFMRNDGGTITVKYVGTDGNSAEFEPQSVTDVVEKVAPGVVSIVTEVRTMGWFGQTSTSTSAGTGMIVTADGYVITNKHVVEDARNYTVILDDGTAYTDVSLVGEDPLNDVAYLKVNNVSDLPTVKLGDSKTITAGQDVIAIGNALGQYQNTVTRGIISGTGRNITAYSSDSMTSETLSDMIQTDAAINAGNSGGPLVNAAGEVIGINTATSTDADGIGFAIPISSVKGMLKNILQNNKAARAYAGVRYVSLTPDVAANYDLPVTAGAYVYTGSSASAIIAGGPGEQAGIKDGDIIVTVNEVLVGKAGTMTSLIGEYMPGETVKLGIVREGKAMTLDLTLGEYK